MRVRSSHALNLVDGLLLHSIFLLKYAEVVFGEGLHENVAYFLSNIYICCTSCSNSAQAIVVLLFCAGSVILYILCNSEGVTCQSTVSHPPRAARTASSRAG